MVFADLKEPRPTSSGTGNLMVFDKAPHPNAAKVFVNWLLSKDGQDFAQKAMKYMSARNDIPTENVSPENRRIAGERYFVGANSVEKWVMNEQDKYLALAKDIFKPVIGR